jgi:hypothetical protein
MRRYGRWGGNPKGTPEDKERCIVSVFSEGRYIPSQCSRKRGYGPNGLYCRQHGRNPSRWSIPKEEV